MNTATVNHSSDIVDIAKAVRKDIRAAIKAGRLPEMKPSVTIDRFSGGQSLSVSVKAIACQVQTDAYLDAVAADPYHYATNVDRFTPEATAAIKALEEIVDVYHWDRSDPQTDYFNCNFYRHVSFATDLTEGERTAAINAPTAHVEAYRAHTDAVRKATSEALEGAETDADAAVARVVAVDGATPEILREQSAAFRHFAKVAEESAVAGAETYAARADAADRAAEELEDADLLDGLDDWTADDARSAARMINEATIVRCQAAADEVLSELTDEDLARVEAVVASETDGDTDGDDDPDGGPSGSPAPEADETADEPAGGMTCSDCGPHNYPMNWVAYRWVCGRCGHEETPEDDEPTADERVRAAIGLALAGAASSSDYQAAAEKAAAVKGATPVLCRDVAAALRETADGLEDVAAAERWRREAMAADRAAGLLVARIVNDETEAETAAAELPIWTPEDQARWEADRRSRILSALSGAHRIAAGGFESAVEKAAAVEDVTPEALRAVADELTAIAARHKGVEFDDARSRNYYRCEAKAARAAADKLEAAAGTGAKVVPLRPELGDDGGLLGTSLRSARDTAAAVAPRIAQDVREEPVATEDTPPAPAGLDRSRAAQRFDAILVAGVRALVEARSEAAAAAVLELVVAGVTAAAETFAGVGGAVSVREEVDAALARTDLEAHGWAAAKALRSYLIDADL